jgi:hypothetical protein
MPSQPSDVRTCVALLACALSLAAGGCARKSVQAAAPAAAPVSADAERPMTVAPDTDATPPTEPVAAPPTLPTAAVPSPTPITVTPSKPAPPRRSAGEQQTAEAESEPSAHPPAPQISPQLSPGDEANYKRKTGEDTTEAEKNLQETSGKQLNAAQQDLVGKIRSFISQSRDASKDGDWTRAQNLAQKARLLSVELINSF